MEKAKNESATESWKQRLLKQDVFQNFMTEAKDELYRAAWTRGYGRRCKCCTGVTLHDRVSKEFTPKSRGSVACFSDDLQVDDDENCLTYKVHMDVSGGHHLRLIYQLRNWHDQLDSYRYGTGGEKKI